MKKIILFVIFLLLSNLASAALNVEINIKNSFIIGETINFNYTITSDIDQTIIYLSYINCQNTPVALLEQKIVNLKLNQPFKETYSDIKVDDSIEPQTCTAYIQILSPTQQKEEKIFEIKTNPSFNFDILLDKKVFIKNEEIKINYNSEVLEPIITTTLTFPDNSKQQINLPTSIKAEQIGTYNLEITVSKEGYRTITKKEQFGVIEKEANISYTKPKGIKGFNWLYIIISIIILIIIGIILYLIKRRKSESFA